MLLEKILDILKSFAVNYLPKIIGSFVIIIIGFLLAKLLRSIVKKHLAKTSRVDGFCCVCHNYITPL